MRRATTGYLGTVSGRVRGSAGLLPGLAVAVVLIAAAAASWAGDAAAYHVDFPTLLTECIGVLFFGPSESGGGIVCLFRSLACPATHAPVDIQGNR